MAVTRDGIPVRCWTFPGSTGDQKIIRRVKDDLGGWNLRRLVGRRPRVRLGRQRGLPGPRRRALHPRREALRHQRRGRGRPGRYRVVAGNLRVKEVWVPPRDAGQRAERFVVCHNPEQAWRDRLVRDRLVAHLQALTEGSEAWPQRKRDELVGSLRDKPGLRQFLRRPRAGCCASKGPSSSGKPASTASVCCAPTTRRSPPMTWPPPTSSWSRSNAAAGGT